MCVCVDLFCVVVFCRGVMGKACFFSVLIFFLCVLCLFCGEVIFLFVLIFFFFSVFCCVFFGLMVAEFFLLFSFFCLSF